MTTSAACSPAQYVVSLSPHITCKMYHHFKYRPDLNYLKKCLNLVGQQTTRGTVEFTLQSVSNDFPEN
jgi:alanine-alpha-ketoisovalerate/valine-pyruvate aminotransferase